MGYMECRANCVVRGVGILVMSVFAFSLASGQTSPEQRPRMAEDVFKNVQVLRGISVNQFMDTMGFFAAALSMNCSDCHTPESSTDLARYGDDTPRKQMARKMVLMVKALNQTNFGGQSIITCYTCHRGSDRPRGVPSLADQYGTPPPDDPNDVEPVPDAPQTPSPDQILNSYIQAVGGAAQAGKLTSFSAEGTYEGYDTFSAKVPLEVFAKGDQRTMVAHAPLGDSVETYDGHNGWKAVADKLSQVVDITGGDLDGMKVDAELSFPTQIRQVLSNWRSGFRTVTVDGQEVQVVQGTAAQGSLVKLYFDKKTGLLLRQVRYSSTIVGVNPTQIDYSDYRAVAGVKIPFRWTVTWTDGQSTFELSTVRPNVAIDAAKFGRPAPPKTRSPTP